MIDIAFRIPFLSTRPLHTWQLMLQLSSTTAGMTIISLVVSSSTQTITTSLSIAMAGAEGSADSHCSLTTRTMTVTMPMLFESADIDCHPRRTSHRWRCETRWEDCGRPDFYFLDLGITVDTWIYMIQLHARAAIARLMQIRCFSSLHMALFHNIRGE